MKYDLDYQELDRLSPFENRMKSKTYLSRNPLIQYVYRRFFRELLAQLENQHFESLLDVGCGEGIVSNLISKNFPTMRIVGVDVDEEVLGVGSLLYSDLSFVSSDLHFLPFLESEFDVVICMEVLEHLTRPSKILVELSRVARKRLILSVPNSKVFRILNALRLKGRMPDHIQDFNAASVDRLLCNFIKARQTKVVNPWILSSIDVSDRRG